MTQPHYIDRACQKCGGEIQGWTCQGCGQVFRENDAGALVFAPMEAVAWREKVAREIATELARQDYDPDYQPEDGWDLTWSYIDQGAVDSGKIADTLQALAVIPTQGGEGR
jgi:hypothetical protein